MGETQNNKMAGFWCPTCEKQVSYKVEGRVPHLPEKAKEFQLPCELCGAKVTVELIRVNGRICSSVYGDDGVGNSC